MTIFTWTILICWSAFILYWISSAFGIKRDVSRAGWWRGWWVRILIVTAVLALWSRHGGSGLHLGTALSTSTGNTAVAALGAVLCTLGIALAIWARAHLGRDWSPVPALKEDHALVTSGPYSFLRHPIYTGMLLATLGSGLVVPVWLVVFLATSAMFLWRIRVEENLMLKEFPNEYPAYKKRTWALVPFIF